MKTRYAFLAMLGLVAVTGSSRASGYTFTTLDDPNATVLFSQIRGISGGTVVGTYEGWEGTYHGFVYDGSTFTTLDVPGSKYSGAEGISGATIVGWYVTLPMHGFIAQPSGPSLQIALTTFNTVFISWPYPSIGWNLHENSDLTTTNWVAPPQAIANHGTNNFIDVGPPSGDRFFRLMAEGIIPAP